MKDSITYNEVSIQRILNPTSIDLGEYVINPYMGCELGCLYCYVRSNRVVSKKTAPWGSYVDIRINAPTLLEKEISKKKPHTVLLGSTTECFQPIEKKYGITKEILEILNKNKVYYVFLTRSPFIQEYISLLTQGFCKMIYFTCNNINHSIKARLEPHSAPFEKRITAINNLLDNNIPVTPYFSPIIPWVSQTDNFFSQFPKAYSIEFEGLNFRLGNIQQIIDSICSEHPHLKEKYTKLVSERKYYNHYWTFIKKEIIKQAIQVKKNYNVYIHKFGTYFENTYTKG
ncbi:radical SAM protein [Chlamydiota bacterium]